MDSVEAYWMMNGMCEDEGVKKVKLIRDKCQDTRESSKEVARGLRCTKLNKIIAWIIEISQCFEL